MKQKAKKFSSHELQKMRSAGKSRSDWAKVKRFKDNDIDFSDSPEIPPEVFAKAILQRSLSLKPHKLQLTLRIDGDVLEWFKAQGRGYQTRINALLRAYKEAHGRTV